MISPALPRNRVPGYWNGWPPLDSGVAWAVVAESFYVESLLFPGIWADAGRVWRVR